MGLLYLLLGLQTAAAFAGGVFLWRRQERQSAEIVRLREALAAAQERRVVKGSARRAGAAGVIPLAISGEAISPAPAPLERAQRAWNLDTAPTTVTLPHGLSVETARGLTLGVLALIPALGLGFGADTSIVVACGLAIGAAMITIAHLPVWRAAAWAGAATSGAWALVGFAVASAHTDPVSYAICASLAAIAGLMHAHMHRETPGTIMALAMLAALLALGSQIGMISPAGVAFGLIVAVAAIVGAMSLRLERMHLAAFGASLIGLFVLSGQDSAAVWFTPATAWAGAVFFAISAIRVPQAGARGVAIAGTGALAPLAAIAALYVSHHGLADRFAAAGGFAALSALLVGVIAAAAMRRGRGLDGLKVTLWVLAFGAFMAFAAAVSMTLPAALTAPAFALAALCLTALDLGLPSRAWRAFACISSACTAFFAFSTAQIMLSEASTWPAFALILSGVATPALIVGAAASAARRRHARLSAAFMEMVAMALAVGAANLAVRALYSGGAMLLQPISFAETGSHVSVWLASALIIRSRALYGARATRLATANLLLVGALGVLLAATLFWMTPFWGVRPAAIPVLSRDTFGFLAPAALLFATWRLWRSRDAEPQARLSLGAGSLLLAAFVTVEMVRADGDADWLGAVVGAVAFAMAIGANFAPGVVRDRAKPRETIPSRSAPQAAH